jgi:hypothetical protein
VLLIILLNCDGEGPAVSNFIIPICSSTTQFLLESTIRVVDCDKDGINVAVALIIISNAVNESQASIVYKPFHAGSVAPDMVIDSFV